MHASIDVHRSATCKSPQTKVLEFRYFQRGTYKAHTTPFLVPSVKRQTRRRRFLKVRGVVYSYCSHMWEVTCIKRRLPTQRKLCNPELGENEKERMHATATCGQRHYTCVQLEAHAAWLVHPQHTRSQQICSSEMKNQILSPAQCSSYSM